MGAGWGVRVDVNKEFKFFGKFTKKKMGGGGRGGGKEGGCQVGGRLVRCERRSEFFVKFQKILFYFFILLRGGGGGGGGG